MTTFEQAVHIFRKDARHLRLEIGGVLLLTLLMIVTGIQTWEGLQERGGASDFDGPFTVLLPLTWCLLIARSIQTEALPGDRHFWLTRPYSRTGLVVAKLLFIGAFVNLPFLVAQAAIVVFDGLPLTSYLGGLLWNQVLVSMILLLPIAAIAALTRNLAQFLPTVVLVGALFAISASGHGSRPDLEWIYTSLGLSVVAVIGALVVWRQYRLRRSGNTALMALAATIAGMILYLGFPQSAAFAVQGKVVGTNKGKLGLHLGDPVPVKGDVKGTNRYRQLVELPIRVDGEIPGNLRVGTYHFTLKTLSGATRRIGGRLQVGKGGIAYRASIDKQFFDAAKNSPVSLQAEYSLTQFGDAGSTKVPLDGKPVYIAGLGQCGAAVNYDQRIFVCRNAFRDPGAFSSDRIIGREECRPCWTGYSPFPAHISIHPIASHTYRILSVEGNDLAPATPEVPAIVVARKPVAYFNYTMDVPNVRLANYAIPEPKDGDDQ